MRPCYVDVEMTFIEKISGVEQSFKADFYFTMYAQAELWTENSTLQIGSVTESEGEVTAIGGPLPEFVNGDSLEFRSRAWTLFPPNISATSIQGLSLLGSSQSARQTVGVFDRSCRGIFQCRFATEGLSL